MKKLRKTNGPGHAYVPDPLPLPTPEYIRAMGMDEYAEKRLALHGAVTERLDKMSGEERAATIRQALGWKK